MRKPFQHRSDTMMHWPHRVPAIRRMCGASAIKMLLLIPAALVLLLVLAFAFFEGRKAYWDYRVREMCVKDGGVKVYERVTLPQRYVNRDGIIRIPFEPHATLNDEYFIRTIRTPIVDGYLSVGRHQTQLVRATDKRLLAEVVSYGRGGGDFPTFAHPSYVSCQTSVNSIDSMNQQVFLR